MTREFKDTVAVPYELLEWINTEEAKELLEKVRANTNATSISFYLERPGLAFAVVLTEDRNALVAACALLDQQLKHQVEYQVERSHTEKLHKDLQATQEEFKIGLRVAFSVPEALIGLVIGKGGANVNKVKEATGVDRVVVDNKTRIVRIRGPNPEAVAQARAMLEFKEIFLPIEADHVKGVIGEKGRLLSDIWRKSNCVNISLETKDGDQSVIRIVGTIANVDLAKKIIQTQIDHVVAMHSVRKNGMHLERELKKIDAEFREFGAPSYPSGNSNNRKRGNQSSKSATADSVVAVQEERKISNATNNNNKTRTGRASQQSSASAKSSASCERQAIDSGVAASVTSAQESGPKRSSRRGSLSQSKPLERDAIDKTATVPGVAVAMQKTEAQQQQSKSSRRNRSKKDSSKSIGSQQPMKNFSSKREGSNHEQKQDQHESKDQLKQSSKQQEKINDKNQSKASEKNNNKQRKTPSENNQQSSKTPKGPVEKQSNSLKPQTQQNDTQHGNDVKQKPKKPDASSSKKQQLPKKNEGKGIKKGNSTSSKTALSEQKEAPSSLSADVAQKNQVSGGSKTFNKKKVKEVSNDMAHANRTEGKAQGDAENTKPNKQSSNFKRRQSKSRKRSVSGAQASVAPAKINQSIHKEESSLPKSQT